MLSLWEIHIECISASFRYRLENANFFSKKHTIDLSQLKVNRDINTPKKAHNKFKVSCYIREWPD